MSAFSYDESVKILPSVAQYESVSTLGPERTNSHDAAQSFLRARGGCGAPVLSRTAEDSFEELLAGRVDGCVVCNLYPAIHELYLPNLHRVYAADVFLFPASMGLFARRADQVVRTVAAPPTSTAFLHKDDFEWIWAPSNAEAARMCQRGDVDGAVGTDAAAAEVNLVKIRDFGEFPVPYTVFRLKPKEEDRARYQSRFGIGEVDSVYKGREAPGAKEGLRSHDLGPDTDPSARHDAHLT